MKFKLLLAALYAKMMAAVIANSRFRNFIKNRRMAITIRTADGQLGRRYVFNEGWISTTSDLGKQCDASMVWCDADTAFTVMASGNEEASVAALTEKKLQVDGNFKDFLWFSRALDIMVGKA